jgi:hypothetical protein
MGLAASDWLFLIGIVLLVMLFMGPGLWSNHDELPITYLWRRLRGKSKKPPDAPPRE